MKCTFIGQEFNLLFVGSEFTAQYQSPGYQAEVSNEISPA
jgi:hypothetical protein